MGHQSYVLPYDTAEEREEILRLCRLHNNWDCNMRVATGMTNEQQHKEWMDRIYEVGEELEGFIDTSWKPGKEFKKRGYYRALASHKNVILCGHGGGRSSTFEFFHTAYAKGRAARYIHCVGYEGSMDKRLEKGTEVEL